MKVLKKYLSNDLLFKYIYGTNENRKYTKYLLETILNKPPEILNVLEILNNVKLAHIV